MLEILVLTFVALILLATAIYLVRSVLPLPSDMQWVRTVLVVLLTIVFVYYLYLVLTGGVALVPRRR